MRLTTQQAPDNNRRHYLGSVGTIHYYKVDDRVTYQRHGDPRVVDRCSWSDWQRGISHLAGLANYIQERHF